MVSTRISVRNFLASARQPDAFRIVSSAIIALFLTFSAAAQSFAQDLDALRAEILQHDQRGELEQAREKTERFRVIALREHGKDSLRYSDALVLMAQRDIGDGALDNAEAHLKEALALVERQAPNDAVRKWSVVGMLAPVIKMQGRVEEARALFARMAELMRPLLPKEFDFDGWMALLQGTDDQFENHERLLKENIEIAERTVPDDAGRILAARLNLARFYVDNKRCGQAEPFLEEGRATIEGGLELPIIERHSFKHAYATCLVVRGAYDDAARLHMEILDELRTKGGNPGLRFQPLSEIVQIKRKQGLADEALGYARELAGLQRQQLLAGNRRAALPSRGGAHVVDKFVFEAVIASAWHVATIDPKRRSELFPEVFEAAQWGAQNRAGNAVQQLGARLAAGGDRLSMAVRTQQGLREEWQRLDAELVAHVASGNADGMYEARRRMLDVEQRIASADRLLAQSFPAYHELTGSQALSVQDTQRYLAADEALVVTSVGEKESFVLFVTKETTHWARLDFGEKQLAADVAALRCGLDAAAWQGSGAETCGKLLGVAASVPDVLPFDVERAHALYRALLRPAELLIRDRRLIIVPTGPLTSLPFNVLVTRPVESASGSANSRDLSQAAWLGARQPLSVLPSVASLRALREHARPSRTGTPYMGFGNPLLVGPEGNNRSAWNHATCGRTVAIAKATQRRPVGSISNHFRGSLADVERVRRQYPLPETAEELCAVARTMGAADADVRLGARATEGQIKALSSDGTLATARIVHFATHGLLAREAVWVNSDQAEPALILTPPVQASEADDGLLTASEIAELKLDADWVILSACNTAAGGDDSPEAETLSGLARAFFYAGARALLVSHWAVDSQATVRLITRAFDELRATPSIGRAEAMRRAMQELIGSHGAHPSLWGAFIVIGEGAR